MLLLLFCCRLLINFLLFKIIFTLVSLIKFLFFFIWLFYFRSTTSYIAFFNFSIKLHLILLIIWLIIFSWLLSISIFQIVTIWWSIISLEFIIINHSSLILLTVSRILTLAFSMSGSHFLISSIFSFSWSVSATLIVITISIPYALTSFTSLFFSFSICSFISPFKFFFLVISIFIRKLVLLQTALICIQVYLVFFQLSFHLFVQQLINSWVIINSIIQYCCISIKHSKSRKPELFIKVSSSF